MKFFILLLRKICHASIVGILLVIIFLSPVQAAKGITFSWSANPVEDEVVGYRLYYGKDSRFTGGNYDRYIDFTSLESCPADTNGYGCEPLAANAVSCEDLFRESPKCTVNGLSGGLYFAMTAYTSQEESDYTNELKSDDNSAPSQKVAVLQQIYSLLLL